jgi:hypothetical protein
MGVQFTNRSFCLCNKAREARRHREIRAGKQMRNEGFVAARPPVPGRRVETWIVLPDGSDELTAHCPLLKSNKERSIN